MPKVSDTRKDKAAELVKMLTNGPCFSGAPLGDPLGKLTVKEAEEQFRLWSATWILPRVSELVPELRKKGN